MSIMKDAEIYEILLSVQKIVQGPEFLSWQNSFIEEHLSTFEYGEENKLEYTQIFQQYEDGVEKQIVEGLADGAARLPAFMEALPAYIQSDAGKKDETYGAVTMLMQMSEFEEFKEMMMYKKKERDERAACTDDMLGNVNSSNGAVLSVDGLLAMCAALAVSGDSNEGWETCFRNSWLKIDRKEVEADVKTHKNEIYLRGVMTMNLSYTEALDMMLYFGERRKLWDKNYDGSELPLGGDIYDDDECVICSKLNFGTQFTGFTRICTFCAMHF